MKWKPISELDPDTEVLFRIETNSSEVVLMSGELSGNSQYIYVFNYAGYGTIFDYQFICHINDIEKCGFKSIHFIDPKEIEL